MQRVAPVTSLQTNQDCRWKKPVTSCFKINVDAAVLINDHFFSIGMLIRDSTGSFIRGNVLKSSGSISAFEAEVKGVWEAISWIDSSGLSSIQIEADSLMAVNVITSVDRNFLEVGNIIEDCKEWLLGRDDVCVTYGRRQSNKAAHLIAHSPCLVGCSSILILLQSFCWRR